MRFLLTLLVVFMSNTIFAYESLPELEISKIHPDVYLHKSYQYVDGYGLVSSNGLVAIDGQSAFIIDTPWSETDTENLVSWIEKQGYDLAGSISTHSHDDRSAGIQWLNSRSIPTYASALTNKILRGEGKAEAMHTFDSSEYGLADDTIEAFYPGEGHTIDNIVVWLPKSKVLFGGCFIRSLGSKGLGYTGEASIDKWPESAEKVLSKYPDAAIVFPGHVDHGDISLLEHTRDLAESVAKQAK